MIRRTPALVRSQDNPLYLQIALRLQGKIVKGELAADSNLPSEEQLARDFNVSRVTLRQALKWLEDRGLIRRQQGKGTFVNPPHVQQQLARQVQTIVEALREKGIEPDVEVLSLEHKRLSSPLKEIVGTADQEAVVLQRLYSYKKAPIALVTLYLPLPLSGVAHILAKPENRYETTYSVFEQQMGLPIRDAKHVIKTVKLDAAQAASLGMQAGDVCLGMDRITFSPQGTVMELMSYIYPPERMEFEVTLPRHSDGKVIKIYRGERVVPANCD